MNFVSAQFKAHLYNDLVLANALNLLIVHFVSLNLSIFFFKNLTSSDHLKGSPLVLPCYRLKKSTKKSWGNTAYICNSPLSYEGSRLKVQIYLVQSVHDVHSLLPCCSPFSTDDFDQLT